MTMICIVSFIFIVIGRATILPRCPQNEQWSCSCERTCQHSHLFCAHGCIDWKCKCLPGFYRYHGKCVKLSSCPQNKKCTNGKIYTSCSGGACRNTCKDPTFSRRCRAACIPGCACPKGTVLNKDTDTCVKINECPPTKCENGCKFWFNGCSECECKYGITQNCGGHCDTIYSQPQCVQCKRNVICSLRKMLRAQHSQNKALWIKHKKSVYQYTIQHFGFTLSCFVQKIIVYVSDDKVSQVKFFDKTDGKICTPKQRKIALNISRYQTVDQLFDYTYKLIETADRVKIKYSRFGYPKSINVDPLNHGSGPVDDEFSLNIDCLSFASFNEPQCDKTVCDAKCICNLPREIGRCRAAIHRYFYDHLTNKCEHFKFGGCGGNDNNFQTLEKCENVCENIGTTKKICDGVDCDVLKCSSVKSEICACDLYGKCFTYNNKCMACCDHPKKRIKSIMKGPCSFPNKCRLPKNKGLCFAHFSRYFYDGITQTCKPFIYGGCGGNRNNFITKHDCEYECTL